MVAAVIDSVCLITGEYPPASGGIADYSAHLAGALRARGVRVDVVTSQRPEAPTAGGLTCAVAGGVVSQHLGTEAGFLLLGVGHAAMCVKQALQLRSSRRSAGQDPRR